MKTSQTELPGVQLDETTLDGWSPEDGPFEARALSQLASAAGVLVRDVYFEGLDVLRCYEGSFRFTVSGRNPIILPAGRSLVIYPGRKVTIEALEEKNRLVYCILGGAGVVAYFAQLGFPDRSHLPTPSQYENFRFVRELAKSPEVKTLAGRSAVIINLMHMFETMRESALQQGYRLCLDAVRKMYEGVQSGGVSADTVASSLGVSRTRLFADFKKSEWNSPGDVIHEFQLCRARELLKSDTNANIEEIARKTGFASASHFASFMKRMTGLSPRHLRG